MINSFLQAFWRNQNQSVGHGDSPITRNFFEEVEIYWKPVYIHVWFHQMKLSKEI